MANKIVYILLFIGFSWVARSQDITIRGIVTDAVTNEPVAYAAVLLEGTTTGAQTDDDGAFTIKTNSSSRSLRVSYLGYEEQKVSFTPGQNMPLRIKLQPSSIDLDEVIIRPGKERYSKRENPAVIFVRNVIASRESNDPRNEPYFTYDQYERMVFAMNDFEPKQRADSTKTGRFDFLAEFIDTLDIGRTVLPISEKERFETVYYRKDPKSEKRLVHATKSAGIDEIFSRDGVHQLLTEVFREVNIFQNDIPLFLNRFVSPLSTQGPNFYKYYLLDTLEINNQQVVDLGFVPFNSETWGFTGHLFVTLDSTFFVQRAILNVPRNINLNFVDNMTIEQTFRRTEDGTRLITKDDIQVDFKLTPKSKGMYARRLNSYSNHTFEEPANLAIFKESQPVITVDDAMKKPEEFWVEIRPEEAQKRNPNTVERLMARLRAVPLFYVTEKIVTILTSGYIQTNEDKEKSKFEFGPMNTAYSWNAIEGNRFRVGGTTTVKFNDRFFLDGYLAYGTRDDKLKYDIIAEYSFIPKQDYRKSFPVHSLRFEYLYDINQLGQQYAFTNKDNIFIAWKWHQDDRATYLRKAELTYSHESWNGFSYFGVLRNYKEYSTPYAAFDRIEPEGAIRPMNDYQMTEFEIRLRYAPNEKFYQSRNYRYPITLDAPVFTLSHTIAGKGVLGSDYTYNRTEFGIQKRFWFSAWGYLDMYGKAGKVWNEVPYPLLLIPNANLSYSIYPESYSNMLAMEFLNDEYASWDVTYYMNGALFNRIPLLKKLKWREVLSFRGLYGNLTDKNNPLKRPEAEGLFLFPEGSYAMGKDPYMEYSLGIENIFKFIRLDYTRRLNYLEHPSTPKHGIRFMMKLNF
ncbi:MAG: DUF5686 and carboxypeptidase regulatory-like domain-containing protein [Tannerellaceae bacterium]|nr:DUF5686 and carboxypeptidase regulatory-like domain-containing protein [Tannerellaceae bacterium]